MIAARLFVSRIRSALTWLVSSPATVFILGTALYFEYVSLHWRYWHDSPLMVYIAQAMHMQGKVPYRDIFDMNPPGTHLLHQFMVMVAGTSDRAIRIFDIAWLFATQTAIYAFMRKFGRAAALAAACLYTFANFHWGALATLEREYFCALPLGLALYIGLRTSWKMPTKLFAVGFFHGFVACIKPPLLVSLPVVLAAIWVAYAPVKANEWPRHAFGILHNRPRLAVGSLLAFAGGLVCFPTFCVGYLIYNDAWTAFGEIWSKYWPLYAQLRGDASVRSDYFEARRFWETLRLNRDYPFFALFGLGLASIPHLWQRSRADVIILMGLWLGFSAYIFISGKFWNYHGFPLYYAESMVAGMALYVPRNLPKSRLVRFFRQMFGFLLVACVWHHPDAAEAILAARPYPLNPDIEQAARILQGQLKSGQTVQPLAVTGGAVHAMLLARAPLATRFMYDFHFYHHPTSRYIQALRAQFLQELEVSRPELIIKTATPMWRTRGPESSGFPELESWIQQNYTELWHSPSLVILRLRVRTKLALPQTTTHE